MRQRLNHENGTRGLGLVRWGSSSLLPCSGDRVFGSLCRLVICQARFVSLSVLVFSSAGPLSEVKVPVICSLNTAINIAIHSLTEVGPTSGA